ncbi:hypothetical protein V8E53_006099 [Lactarius tabidus]
MFYLALKGSIPSNLYLVTLFRHFSASVAAHLGSPVWKPGIFEHACSYRLLRLRRSDLHACAKLSDIVYPPTAALASSEPSGTMPDSYREDEVYKRFIVRHSGLQLEISSTGPLSSHSVERDAMGFNLEACQSSYVYRRQPQA